MTRPPITRMLAEFTHGAHTFPAPVRAAAVQAWVNIIGCMLGGAEQGAVRIARSVALELAGPPTTTLIGRAERVDPLTGAYLNGFSHTRLLQLVVGCVGSEIAP